MSTQVHLGVAVAVEAPPHTQRLVLSDHLHLMDGTVTALAADTGTDMGAVTEVRVVGQVVDPNPPHRLVVLEALTNRLE